MKLSRRVLVSSSFVVAAFGESINYSPAIIDTGIVTGKTIEILLPDFDGSASAKWILACDSVVDQQTAQFSVSSVTLKSTGRVMIDGAPERFTDLDVQVRANRLVVSGQPGPGQPVLMYLKAEPGTALLVKIGPAVVFSGSFGSDLVIRDGRVIPSPVIGPASVLPALLLGSRFDKQEVAQISRKNDGRFFVNQTMLREHFLAGERPGRADLSPCCTGGAPVVLLFNVEIDASGSVLEVVPNAANPSVGGKAAQMIGNWKYRPFLENGVPVPVSATVPIAIAQDGAVLLPSIN